MVVPEAVFRVDQGSFPDLNGVVNDKTGALQVFQKGLMIRHASAAQPAKIQCRWASNPFSINIEYRAFYTSISVLGADQP